MSQLIRATSGLQGQPEPIEITYRRGGDSFILSRTVSSTTIATTLTKKQAAFLLHNLNRFLESQKEG